jgi:AraC-like DNA-binding protein
MAETLEDITLEQLDALKENLANSDLELLYNNKNILVEKIKSAIIQMIRYSDDLPKMKYSEYISDKLKHDYTYLSNIFSEVTGFSIQQFVIKHKLEMVKELLTYHELNLTEISYKLHYSSVAHLSNQFRKTYGISPSTYLHSVVHQRSCLESV